MKFFQNLLWFKVFVFLSILIAIKFYVAIMNSSGETSIGLMSGLVYGLASLVVLAIISYVTGWLYKVITQKNAKAGIGFKYLILVLIAPFLLLLGLQVFTIISFKQYMPIEMWTDNREAELSTLLTQQVLKQNPNTKDTSTILKGSCIAKLAREKYPNYSDFIKNYATNMKNLNTVSCGI